ncbi:MAG: transporter substrate-binding domain-containing protein, partial [Alphaproteobacteria bacterium]|nr:transporter substrate-binding domain-containing protein [Alphaproteobacteria bacterium]
GNKKIISAFMESDPHHPSYPDHKTIAVLLKRVDFGVVVKRGIAAKTYKDLENLNVAFFRGATAVAGLTDNPAINLVYTHDMDHALSLILRNRIHAVWADPISMAVSLKKKNLKYEDHFEDSIFTRSGYPILLSNINHASDPNIARLAEAAQRLQETGELDEIANQFLDLSPLPYDVFAGEERSPLNFRLSN